MKTERLAQQLRGNRKMHRVLGLILALLLIISAITGIFLSWKKEFSFIQPSTQKGQSKDLAEWKPIEELATLAVEFFEKKYPEAGKVSIDRIDVRPSKGVAKVRLEQGWWEVQIDGASGEVLSVARRHSDWIEALHDGSLISDTFKLFSMNILGWGLLVMVISGWFLWYGPKKFRRLKRQRKQSGSLEKSKKAIQSRE